MWSMADLRGGYITRYYGQPEQNLYAIQLELRQALYMDEATPFDYDAQRATTVQPILKTILQAALTQLRSR